MSFFSSPRFHVTLSILTFLACFIIAAGCGRGSQDPYRYCRDSYGKNDVEEKGCREFCNQSISAIGVPIEQSKFKQMCRSGQAGFLDWYNEKSKKAIVPNSDNAFNWLDDAQVFLDKNRDSIVHSKGYSEKKLLQAELFAFEVGIMGEVLRMKKNLPLNQVRYAGSPVELSPTECIDRETGNIVDLNCVISMVYKLNSEVKIDQDGGVDLPLP